MKFNSIASVVLAIFASAASHIIAAEPEKVMPDFTKEGTIPENAKHDWNLGATGMRGWMFIDKLETTQARQISVTQVAKGSPADGKIAVGDVILGVGGKRFSHDPRVEFGKAMTAAETQTQRGKLTLSVWRAGKEKEVALNIKMLGNYSKTAPFSCPKSTLILAEGCKALAVRMQDKNYPNTQNPITRSLNALALLSSGNKEYLPLIRREAEWANQFSSDSFQTWWNAYVIMLLAEYKISTGDDAFVSGLERLALEAAKGQSIVGSWGHRYALPSGNLTGYGMMNAPGVPLTTSLIMARKAGVKDPAIDLAIDRSSKLLRFYIGKGSVPYGDHHPWTQNHDDNGKNGMAGVMFNMLGEKDGAEYFSRMSVAAHSAERDCGHCGNFTNMLWAMPGVALSGPEASGAWMREFGARYYDLSRTWDFSFPHPGAPEPEGDHYKGWDSTGGYLLAYAMPLKKILLTGKQPKIAPQINAATAAALVADGRGWSNNDRNSAYDKLSPEILLEKLASWSPTVRERATGAIMRRPGEKPITTVVKMLDSPNLYARYGACEVLISLNGAAAPAVTKLTALLNHEDIWMRIKAAETLSHIGAPAMPALPAMLDRLAKGPDKSDPRGMEQRYLCFSIFEKMLGNSLEGLDLAQLNKAVTAGLLNQDGRARSSVASTYKLLSFEEIKPLLPAILEASAKPAPSGEMFSDGIRIAGLQVLASHHVAEGILATTDYLVNQNMWASEHRTLEILKILLSYGANAKSAIPALKEAEAIFKKGDPDFPNHLSQQKAEAVRKAISDIEAATDKSELRKIR